MQVIESEHTFWQLFDRLNQIACGKKPTQEETRYFLSIEHIEVLFEEPRVIELPSSIELLSNLSTLVLKDILVRKMPESIVRLRKLTDLRLHVHLQYFDMMEDSNSTSGHAESLDIISPILALNNLRRLEMHGYPLRFLPATFCDLKRLETLVLRRDHLQDLPEGIGNLRNLVHLNLSINDLSSLPHSISELLNLRILNLSSNKLDEIPESVSSLTRLECLDISNNNLRSFNVSEARLKNLVKLNLEETGMRILPESIGKCTKLDALYLDNNMLSTLPESLWRLTQLRELSISNNELHVLSEKVGELVNLQSLDISGNSLSMLPDGISNLQQLRSLDVSSCKISVIPEYLGYLSMLTRLDMQALCLDALPESLLHLGLQYATNRFIPRRAINLKGTTLRKQPISLFSQPHELIQAYYDAEKLAIKDAKVVFLGDGGAGKTYTIQRIRNQGKKDSYNTETTRRIAISPFSHQSTRGVTDISFWDFGGQEIMHSMHRCFLTDRCCYVVVVSNRTSDLTQRAAYWLSNIQTFTRDCPVLLAINKYDNNPNIGINLSELQKNFPNLIGPPIFYSAKDSSQEQFGELTDAIIAQAEKLDSVNLMFPKNWHNIRMELSRRALKKFYIKMEEYYQICGEQGFNIKDETQRQICIWLLDWFNDMGVCFSYHKDSTYGEPLRECQILNPEWLTNAISIIINEGCIYAQNGVILHNTIHGLLNNAKSKRENMGVLGSVRYSIAETQYVLNIMRKFKLSYPISHNAEFIPAICPENTPVGFQPDNYVNHIAYEMEYPYLPDSVLHRLMIVCNEKLKMQQIYRKGLQIEDVPNGITAVVDMGMSTTCIKIDVYSSTETPLWTYLQYLRNRILEINAELQLFARDYIISVKDGKRARVPLSFLLNLKEQGINQQYFPAEDNRSMLMLNVSEELGAAFGGDLLQCVADKAKENQQSMVNVMLDSGQFDELLRQLHQHTAQMHAILLGLGISNDLLRSLNGYEQEIVRSMAELTQSPREEIAKIERKLKRSKRPLDVFSSVLGGVANATQIAGFALDHKDLFAKLLMSLPTIASILLSSLHLQ